MQTARGVRVQAPVGWVRAREGGAAARRGGQRRLCESPSGQGAPGALRLWVCKGSGVCVPMGVQARGAGLGLELCREGGCSRGASALGQPGMGCVCGAARPVAPAGSPVATPAETCRGAPPQPEGLPAGPHHPEPLPVVGTPLSPGNPPGNVALGIRPRSPSLPLGPPGVTSLQPCVQLTQPSQSPRLPAYQSPCCIPRGGPWVSRLDLHEESFSPMGHSHGPASCGGPAVPTDLPWARCPLAAAPGWAGLCAGGPCGCSESPLRGEGHELNVSNPLLAAGSQRASVPDPSRRAGLSAASPLCSGAAGALCQGLRWSLMAQ